MRYLLTGLLCCAVAANAAAGNADYSSPAEVAGATTVDVAAAERLHAADTVFIDVRAPRLHARQHIPGSVHLDLNSAYDAERLAAVVRRDQPFVVYCSGVTCTRSFRAAALAVKWGFTGVHYFRGGVAAWRDAGLPLTRAAETAAAP